MADTLVLGTSALGVWVQVPESVPIVVLYTDLMKKIQLPPALTIVTLFMCSIGYGICGIAAKDHLKINEGEANLFHKNLIFYKKYVIIYM